MSSGLRIRSWRRSGALPAVAAALPVLVFAIVVLANLGDRSAFSGDQALLELWSRSAMRLDALVGPYSRFGWNHPGPAVFYWFAPAYWISGQRPGGLALAAVILNIGCIAWITWSLRRQLGIGAGWIAAGIALAAFATLGITWFDETWNPVMVVLPLVVVGTSAAAVLAGRTWGLVPLVAAASFCVQTHIGTLPVAGAFAGLALVGLVVQAVRREPIALRAIATTAVVALAMWIGPLIQQLTGRPGNLRLLATYTRGAEGRQSTRTVLDAIAAQLSLSGSNLVGDGLSPARLPSASPLRLVLVALLLCAVAAAAWGCARIGRRQEAALGACTVVATAALGLSLMRVEGQLEEYLTFSASALGVLLYLSLALSAYALLAPRLGPDLRRRAIAWAPVAVVAASVVATVAVLGTDPSADLYVRASTPAGADAVVDEILAATDLGDSIRIDVGVHPAWPYATLLANELERAGRTVHVSDRWRFMFGEQRLTEGCDPVTVVVRVPTDGLAPDQVLDDVPVADQSEDIGMVGPASVGLIQERTPTSCGR